MNSRSSDSSPTPPAPSSKPIVWLELKGARFLVSFKNNKMLITKSRGAPLRKPMLITNPERQKVMDEITQSFVSQLLSKCRTIDAAIRTGSSQPSLTALLRRCMKFDDSWTWMPEQHLFCELVTEGEEGVDLVIEQL